MAPQVFFLAILQKSNSYDPLPIGNISILHNVIILIQSVLNQDKIQDFLKNAIISYLKNNHKFLFML